MELGAERGFIGNELPVAVNLSSVLNANVELILVVHEDVSDVHLGNGELCLRTASLAGHV